MFRKEGETIAFLNSLMLNVVTYTTKVVPHLLIIIELVISICTSTQLWPFTTLLNRPAFDGMWSQNCLEKDMFYGRTCLFDGIYCRSMGLTGNMSYTTTGT